MKRVWAGAVTFVLAAIAIAEPAGQKGPARVPQTSSSSTAILVDVVVRDSRGRPVTDLSAADFDIAEDGVPQTIGSFSRVSRGTGIGIGVALRAPRPVAVPAVPAGTTDPVQTADAPPEQATTALVFDHLSAETLGLAQKATLNHVPLSGTSNVQIGVFSTDVGVRALQRYTKDLAQVRRAVGRVLPVGGSDADQRADRSDDLTAQRRTLAGQADAAAAGAAAGSGAALARNAAELGARETELRLVQTELNMLRSIDHAERGHKGYDTSASLFAVVRSLAEYPGRKTIVFFSEGLPVSPTLSARLDAVIEAANRSNVTVYAIDTKGLRAKSATDKARKELDAFSEERRSQVGSGSDRTGQPLTMAMEHVEDTLTVDSRAGLARLAGDTGGFLVEGSNDLAAAFRRIDEDNQFHYLLTYAPSNDTPDGRFRTIRVRVGRQGAQVFARKGYRALRAGVMTDAVADEVAATALLDRAPLPNAFPIHAAAFSFPDPARPGLSPVIVHVATGSLRFEIDAQRSGYAARATVLVRIKDGDGRRVQTLSQQYLVSGDAKDLDAAKSGTILFYREPDLAPGVYTMEALVFDAAAQRGSVRVSTLTVPEREAHAVSMSSLVLVSRAEELTSATAPELSTAGPLYVGRTLLYPNLGEPIHRSPGAELTFYFALYGRTDAVKASVDLLRNGQTVASAPVDLPAATGSRVQHVARLPIGRLPAGTYELRIVVTGAGRDLSRTAYFTLKE
jgi:VWFA-related protein